MIEDFLGIAVVGGLLSVIMEWISEKFGVQAVAAKILVVILSLVVGSVYVFLKDTPWWSTVVGVLMASSTVYALLIK